MQLSYGAVGGSLSARARREKPPREISRRAPSSLPGVSCLADIATRLEVVPEIGVVRLAEQDIVRHPLAASMIGLL